MHTCAVVILLYQYPSYPDWRKDTESNASHKRVAKTFSVMASLFLAAMLSLIFVTFLVIGCNSSEQDLKFLGSHSEERPWIPFCPLPVNTVIQIKARKFKAGQWKSAWRICCSSAQDLTVTFVQARTSKFNVEQDLQWKVRECITMTFLMIISFTSPSNCVQITTH